MPNNLIDLPISGKKQHNLKNKLLSICAFNFFTYGFIFKELKKLKVFIDILLYSQVFLMKYTAFSQ